MRGALVDLVVQLAEVLAHVVAQFGQCATILSSVFACCPLMKKLVPAAFSDSTTVRRWATGARARSGGAMWPELSIWTSLNTRVCVEMCR